MADYTHQVTSINLSFYIHLCRQFSTQILTYLSMLRLSVLHFLTSKRNLRVNRGHLTFLVPGSWRLAPERGKS